VNTTLAARQGYKPGDLISRGEVAAVCDALKQAGWDVPNRSELVKLSLDDGHFLVTELRTPDGVKFSRAIAGQSLPFDRLDRLSQQSGGEKLIHSLVTIPNGAKLMSSKPTPGFGDLNQLLPKQASGLTPKDKDFDKPTGKIYTEAQLVKALEKVWVETNVAAARK
jgi:hypothetical protein